MRTGMRIPAWAMVAALFVGVASGCAGTDEDGADDAGEALSTAKLTPADVSILLPLPKTSADETLAATAIGRDGEELLPETALKIDGAPNQDVLNLTFYWDHGKDHVTTTAEERKRLRLTAVRIDPCGRVAPGAPESACVPEIRLVFQPVLANRDGVFEAADGAVHAFYRVTTDELQGFAKAMFDARNASGGFAYTRLGVHPTLAKQGLGGTFAKTLFTKLKALCGGKNLERVTFLQRTNSREPVWVFGITSVKDEIAKVQTIASTTSTVQALEGPGFDSPMHLTELSGRPGAKPTETGTADKVSAILDTRTTSEAAQIAGLNASVRIDNPLIHSPETMSCVECHVASGARRALLDDKPALKAKIDPANVFKAPMTANHVVSKDVSNLHAFSWKGTDLGISDRAANDSAAVAAKMNALVFGR